MALPKAMATAAMAMAKHDENGDATAKGQKGTALANGVPWFCVVWTSSQIAKESNTRAEIALDDIYYYYNSNKVFSNTCQLKMYVETALSNTDNYRYEHLLNNKHDLSTYLIRKTLFLYWNQEYYFKFNRNI